MRNRGQLRNVPTRCRPGRPGSDRRQGRRARRLQRRPDPAGQRPGPGPGGRRESATSARQEADRLQADLADRRGDRETEQSLFNLAAENDTGLLARLEALASLGTARPDLGIAQLVLLLLFLSLEVLPVLVKLLQLAGPPTMYEQFVVKMEEAAHLAAAKATNREANIADDYAQMQAELEHDQARLQYEAGLRANKLIVSRQEAIARQSILRWSAEAERRSNQELTDWFHAQQDTRPLTIDGRTIPMPPPDGHRRSPTTDGRA